MCFNIIKVIYDKPTANFIHHGEKLKTFSPTSGKRQSCPLLSLLFNIARETRQKRNKIYLNWKERSKTVTVCRYNNYTSTKSWRFHQNMIL